MKLKFVIAFGIVGIVLTSGSTSAAEPSAGIRAWKEGVARLNTARDAEKTLKGLGIPVTPVTMERYRQCHAKLVDGFKHAMAQGYASEGMKEYFTIEIPASGGATLRVTYTFVNAAPAVFSLEELPPSWRLVAVSAGALATGLTIFTDDSTGCAFQFDTLQPFDALGSVSPLAPPN
ncbi:MAG: hypothetical protein WC538_07490 [Thermoanaerobaculia bacterium]|jgi:hypothetical protein